MATDQLALNTPMARPLWYGGKASKVMAMAMPTNGPAPMAWTILKKMRELVSQAMEQIVDGRQRSQDLELFGQVNYKR